MGEDLRLQGQVQVPERGEVARAALVTQHPRHTVEFGDVLHPGHIVVATVRGQHFPWPHHRKYPHACHRQTEKPHEHREHTDEPGSALHDSKDPDNRGEDDQHVDQ